MDYNGFCKWLMGEKKMSTKSAHDVVSRLRRLLAVSGDNEINSHTLDKVEKSEVFSTFTMCVKSQIRRAAHLAEEYKLKKKK